MPIYLLFYIKSNVSSKGSSESLSAGLLSTNRTSNPKKSHKIDSVESIILLRFFTVLLILYFHISTDYIFTHFWGSLLRTYLDRPYSLRIVVGAGGVLSPCLLIAQSLPLHCQVFPNSLASRALRVFQHIKLLLFYKLLYSGTL